MHSVCIYIYIYIHTHAYIPTYLPTRQSKTNTFDSDSGIF